MAKQKEAVDRLLLAAEQSFQEKQAASARRDWCDAIPLDRKVDTVQSFLKAFHGEESMEIGTCSVCYLKKKPQDLDRVNWKRALNDNMQSTIASIIPCERCSVATVKQLPLCRHCGE